ncbi:MAG: heme-copper oxidase subunit III [Verrucomicrobia bacterium]|nr:heme-copper oxidase subunit III [Verrucomicrobiota bacterium]MBV8483355.1 heme-copper oxidase subunit III [Verrucomicrobiota bacterium]
MSASAVAIDSVPHKVGPNVVRFGMLTFLASEAMLFSGLICGYMVLRAGAGSAWQMPEGLKGGFVLIKTIAATLCLLASSFTLHFSEARLIKGTRYGKLLLVATILLGTLFLSNQADEWRNLFHEGFWFNTAGIMGSCFFVLTGFHGCHVAIGVLLLITTLIRALTGNITPEKHGFLECTGLYWHFVDIVWVFLFTILYIL